jgi:hypothetical protein
VIAPVPKQSEMQEDTLHVRLELTLVESLILWSALEHVCEKTDLDCTGDSYRVLHQMRKRLWNSFSDPVQAGVLKSRRKGDR